MRRAVLRGRVITAFALLAVILAAMACGGDSNGRDAYGERHAIDVSGSSVTVDMNDLQFNPKGIRVRPGTTVTWVNNEPVIHNVRQVESRFLSPDVMVEGDTFSFTFEEPGTYRYQCTYHHPDMNGVVIVEKG